MKTLFAIMITLLVSSCALLQETPECEYMDHARDGMRQLSLIERQRLAERTGIPLRFWNDQQISVSLALALKKKYQLSDAYFTNE